MSLRTPTALFFCCSCVLGFSQSPKVTEDAKVVCVRSNEISLEFSSTNFGSWKAHREPRLTIQENGTDIPLDIAPARTRINIEIRSSALHPASEMKAIGDAQIQVIPLSDSTVPDFKSAYPDLSQNVEEIGPMLKGKIPRVKACDYLPDWNCVDMHQTIHSKAQIVKTAWCSGIQFITQYTQEETGIDNQGLTYVFQGISNDGAYYIAARIPVSHPILPLHAPYIDQMPGETYEQYQSRVGKLYLQIEDKLNLKQDDSFVPSLITLRNLVNSIRVTPK